MRIALPLVALLAPVTLLVACERHGDSPPAAPEAPAAPTSPAAPGELPPAVTDVDEGEARWMLSQDGENRFLAFAVPETDDVRFSLECGPKERFVRLWRETMPDDHHDFRLSSGDSSPTIEGEYDPEGMAPQLRGVAAARIPVFVNFRQTGQLSMTAMGQTQDMSASPMARPLIESFFAYCGPAEPANGYG